MGIFGLGKRKDVLDLSEKLKRQQESKSYAQTNSPTKNQNTSEPSSQDANPFTFFDNPASSSTIDNQSSNSPDVIDLSNHSSIPSGSTEERRRKLIKRITDMTERLEDLSNQIYHLQQRIEVLERRSGSSYGQ